MHTCELIIIFLPLLLPLVFIFPLESHSIFSGVGQTTIFIVENMVKRKHASAKSAKTSVFRQVQKYLNMDHVSILLNYLIWHIVCQHHIYNYFNFLRVFNLFAGLFLAAALFVQSQSNNICIWRVSCCVNIPIAFIVAYAPKYVGKWPIAKVVYLST